MPIAKTGPSLRTVGRSITSGLCNAAATMGVKPRVHRRDCCLPARARDRELRGSAHGTAVQPGCTSRALRRSRWARGGRRGPADRWPGRGASPRSKRGALGTYACASSATARSARVSSGARGRLLRCPARRLRGDRGAHGRRQDDAPGPPPPVLRPRGGGDPPRSGRPQRLPARRPAQAVRHRPPGAGPLLDEHLREHRLRPPRGERGPDHRRRRGRRPHVHLAAPPRVPPPERTRRLRHGARGQGRPAGVPHLAGRSHEVIAGADERAVPEASLETPRLADEESELHRCLAGRFPSLRGIRRAAFGGQTSFRLEVLTLELGAAGEVKLLLKDFGASRLPKDDLPSRRNRELRVYRDLLAGGGLGTAEYHGAVWDEARGRFWLLLELVDGVELRSLGFEDWVR